ncbi:MAG: S1/P1 nuclease [Terriglobales bacterium]
MRGFLRQGVLLLAVLALGVSPAWGWGCAGHEVIALIAAAHLRPEVAAEVRALLAVPTGEDVRHPCRAAAQLPAMARVAGWADAVRTPATASFHFVNLPLGARRGEINYASLCAGTCLSAALARFEAELQDRAAPTRERAVALRYVIHLVGDAFQPLHVSDDNDEGGNCVRTRLPGTRRRSNLHADWDSRMLARMMRQESPAIYARQLDRRLGRRYAQGSPAVLDWIWSSHVVAVRSAYEPLHLAPGCHARTVSLSRAYVRGADAVIRRQLDRAGWRLAEVLNRLFPAR